MLDTITLLSSMQGIGEEKVYDTAKALGLLDRQTCHRQNDRKAWRLVLLAAILTALLTACAVGYSIHQRRQQELRESFEVEEKHVDAWVDYNVSTQDNRAASTEPVLTLLSQYNDGVFCTVYLNASPVDENEVVNPFILLEEQEDGWCHRLEYRFSVQGGEYKYFAHLYWNGGGDYAPEDYLSEEPVNVDGQLRPEVTQEARFREMKKQCYDPATKTLTLKCSILLSEIAPDEPVSLALVLWDYWLRGEGLDIENYERKGEQRRSLGSVSFTLTPQQTCTIHFEDPIVITNEERGKTGRILSVEISATQMVWHLTHEEQEIAYREELWDGDRAREQFEISLSWSSCIDAALQEATLNFDDGTRLHCGGAVASRIEEGEVTVVSYHSTDEKGTKETVIDLHKLVSITIGGQSYPLPPVEDIRG